MSLTFALGWQKEVPHYVQKFGSYQQQLYLLTKGDVKFALNVASLLYREGAVGDMLRAAIAQGGDKVEVEQGSHQQENIKDKTARPDVKAFDLVKDKTLHFTLRHYSAAFSPKGNLAFHCYLSRNVRNEWGITTISSFQKGVGLEMAQTGGRDFMSMLAKRFIMAHGYEDD